MHGHRYGRRFRKEAWPFIAMMAASRGGPWGGAGFGSGWGSGWDGEAMRGGPGRRRGRMFGQGELRLVLLKLIADQPRHGYELIKAIEELTGGTYSPSPGTIYPTLQLLADEGMIGEQVDEVSARKPFAVTQDGRDELLDKESEVAAVFDRLSDHGERASGSGAPHDLLRAAGNLASVLRHKYRAGALGEEARREVVDWIDELARRIERL